LLEYREFPYRTAITYLLFSVPLALFIYVILGLLSGTLFDMTLLEHHGYLGYGALAVVFTLPTIGLVADKVKKLDPLIYLFAVAPSIIGILRLLPFFTYYHADLDLALVISSFVGISALLVLWILRLGQSVVVKYRGRTTALFLTIAIVLQFVYSMVEANTVFGSLWGAILPSIMSFIVIIISAGLKPWKQPRVPLTVSGNSMRYFVPTIFILASHLLWYSVTKFRLQEFFVAYDPTFVTLTQYLGFEIYEIIILCISVVIAGIMADTKGRRTTFSFLLLLMGLLTIFGSAFYEGFFIDTNLTGLLMALLISERIVEGFLLGICLLLIWPELGTVRTKGIRLSMIWFFFLGYMTLFWALDLNLTIFGFAFVLPVLVTAIGGQFAILSALIALYLIGPLPKILGREIEVEELALDFDEKQVKSTVDAFVGSDDFDSIRHQIDIIDAGAEISDSDMSEILGEEFKDMLPLRSVPGIGTALEKKLKAAGYESAAQLAGETAQRLSQKVEGLSLTHAEKLLKDARSVVKTKIKQNSK
jgi:hypothetical protein